MAKPQSPYASCRLCPRNCDVNRLTGEQGFCGETSELRLSVAGLHFGEEPPLTGTGGSGTLFVTGCALSCPFCQNHQISRCGLGRTVTADEFLAICRALESAGAENINLVTPSHMTPTLAEYMKLARMKGFALPVAWNSSGYESSGSVETAAEFVKIWLPDLKTLDPEVAGRRYGIADYPAAAEIAIRRMAEAGPVTTDRAGRMTGGLMIRHLVLPGELESSRQVMQWFADNLAGRAWLSLMTQYTPVKIPGENREIPGRQLNPREYDRLLDWLEEFGIDDGFVQDLVPGDDWLPDFHRPNPFSSDLSRILWRWDCGFSVPQ